MDAFFTDPGRAPDTSCISQRVAFAAPKPVSATAKDGTATIRATFPPRFVDTLTPNVYSTSNLSTLGAIWAGGTTVATDDLIDDVMKGLEFEPDSVSIGDGDPVAGYPTRRLQTDGRINGNPGTIDVIAFRNDLGVYAIEIITVDQALSQHLRAVELPAILESVTVGTE